MLFTLICNEIIYNGKMICFRFGSGGGSCLHNTTYLDQQNSNEVRNKRFRQCIQISNQIGKQKLIMSELWKRTHLLYVQIGDFSNTLPSAS